MAAANTIGGKAVLNKKVKCISRFHHALLLKQQRLYYAESLGKNKAL